MRSFVHAGGAAEVFTLCRMFEPDTSVNEFASLGPLYRMSSVVPVRFDVVASTFRVCKYLFVTVGEHQMLSLLYF